MSNLILGGITAVAGGTIPQTAFVKKDPTADYQAVAAAVGDEPCGVSQRWGIRPTFSSDTGLPPAALVGQGFTYYGPGVPCQLTAGAGGWAAGDKLKPDANGAGVVASAGDKYGAIADQACVAGAIGQVTVRVGVK